MKYKVGDKVQIASVRRMTDWNFAMNEWLGTIMTIRSARSNGYRMLEDRKEHYGNGWFWEECMIEGLAEEESTVDISGEELMDILNI